MAGIISSTPNYRGRIAPSPTGYLHVGHAKTFWTAYCRCRRNSGSLVYRDEDIDGPRCKPEFSKAAVEDLTRLGIAWDEGPIRQSDRLAHYQAAWLKLVHEGLIYASPHSRKDVKNASDATRNDTGEIVFPPLASSPQNAIPQNTKKYQLAF